MRRWTDGVEPVIVAVTDPTVAIADRLGLAADVHPLRFREAR